MLINFIRLAVWGVYNLRSRDEWQKSASKEDFFILFTTKEKLNEINLPKNCGLVSGDEWRRNFGPFSGRARK